MKKSGAHKAKIANVHAKDVLELTEQQESEVADCQGVSLHIKELRLTVGSRSLSRHGRTARFSLLIAAVALAALLLGRYF